MSQLKTLAILQMSESMEKTYKSICSSQNWEPRQHSTTWIPCFWSDSEELWKKLLNYPQFSRLTMKKDLITTNSTKWISLNRKKCWSTTCTTQLCLILLKLNALHIHANWSLTMDPEEVAGDAMQLNKVLDNVWLRGIVAIKVTTVTVVISTCVSPAWK